MGANIMPRLPSFVEFIASDQVDRTREAQRLLDRHFYDFILNLKWKQDFYNDIDKNIVNELITMYNSLSMNRRDSFFNDMDIFLEKLDVFFKKVTERNIKNKNEILTDGNHVNDEKMLHTIQTIKDNFSKEFNDLKKKIKWDKCNHAVKDCCVSSCVVCCKTCYLCVSCILSCFSALDNTRVYDVNN